MFREGDAFFEPGNAGKILVAGTVDVIDRDTISPSRDASTPNTSIRALGEYASLYRQQFRGVDRGFRESRCEAWSHAPHRRPRVLSWITKLRFIRSIALNQNERFIFVTITPGRG